MRIPLLAGVLAALLLPASAVAGDPILPLSEVRQGMQCTGYSVIRGTEPVAFDVEILDVVSGDRGPGSSQLLVRVSGEAVEDTGVGAGFSGSPIYCDPGDGIARNAGAISATIGDYGGRTVLATPIEAILAADAEPEPAGRAREDTRRLASPITIRGLSDRVFAALQRRARAQGRTLLQAPPRPLRSAPPSELRPGSAVGVGLSSGDVAVGAVGTVAYVDGPRVWALGHEFDGVGRRNLFLQNAYVATVINNPVQLAEGGGTYKLAAATNDIGTVSDDTFSAVAGSLGGLPASIPVRVHAHDAASGRRTTTEVRVADETSVGTPAGISALSFVAPVAVAQAAAGLHPSVANRILGRMCLRIELADREDPLRICNRYVSDGTGQAPSGGDVVALKASADTSDALALLDAYKGADLDIRRIEVTLRVRRGQHQAFLRSVRLPRRARAGSVVTARLRVQRVRGRRETVKVRFRAPRRPGERRIVFRGTDADSADDDLFGGLLIDFDENEEDDTTGPTSLDELEAEVEALERYDGLRVSGGRRAGAVKDLRIGGRAEASLRVTR